MSERLTEQEHDALLQQDFGGDEELALAFGVHCRALLGGKLPGNAHAEPAYSSTASDHRKDGTVRTYACLADHRGLVAVYRLRASGRFVRMTRWPAWIVANDQDPEWREHCRCIEANRRRRQRRRMAKFQQWADGFIARTMPPVTSAVAASGLLCAGSP
ncbi:hypothetical protein [Methylobacterium sp. Leaf108]|uniref:hypothetical protein n=1 Tax=Methylobacterium sp. Leaf108 TaxID=1736256 RepID=UPI0006F68422|nr:hypothetical protein [Methylobacterium sp. Leaf108]KQP55049.1 hypothetical protein ASF39_04760 [Methylobacterium sp. Leaf108]